MRANTTARINRSNKIPKIIFAIPAALLDIFVNPKISATTEIMKKTSDQNNLVTSYN